MAAPPADGHDDAPDDVTGALHDVSNALTVLLGWVAEARAEDAPPETVAFALDIIERRARMARALARRAIGATPMDGEGEDDLEALLRDVVEGLRIEADRAGVTLVRSLAAPEASVSASGRPMPLLVRVLAPAEASHALTNLLLNALAYAPAGSAVRVRVTVDDRAFLFDVEDDGPGVAPEVRPQIFSGVSLRRGGAGVGLRHARAMARAVDGDLVLLESVRGARFRLTWPRLDPRIPLPPPSLSRRRPLEGRRILVVEDDPDVVGLLETALGARGAVVTVARTQGELGPALRGEPHDAALLDMSPLEKDLRGALDALRAHSPEARLVVITGSTGGLPPELAPRAARWVRKPFEVSEVVDALVRAPSATDEGPASVRGEGEEPSTPASVMTGGGAESS